MIYLRILILVISMAVATAFVTLNQGQRGGGHFTCRVGSASQATLEELKADVSSRRNPSEGSLDRVRKSPFFHRKAEERVLKTVQPFRLSALESEYLAGVALFVNRYTSINTFLFTTNDRLAGAASSTVEKIRKAARMSSRAPRIMAKLYSPLGGSGAVRVKEGVQTVDAASGSPNPRAAADAIVERIAYLILEDLDNVRQGIYPLPSELQVGNQVSAQALGAVTKEFLDMLDFGAQGTYIRQDGARSSTTHPSSYFQQLAQGVDNLPDYYVNDFHSVEGGFLAPEHVSVYDALSEFVFLGTHFMARRMMLPPIVAAIRGMKSRGEMDGNLRLLDVGTGTGSFLTQAFEALGDSVEFYGIDLSPAMITHAKKICNRAGFAAKLKQANMEEIPEADESFDFVTHSNCFHEMPESAIRNAANEFARILKPGGLFVHHDAVQMVDDPSVAELARPLFDKNFNEPFMWDWQRKVDLDEIMAEAGLIPAQAPKPLYASCVRVYRKE